MSDLVFARNFCLARMLPREDGVGVGMKKCLAGSEISVKRSERSNGPDTVLYKSYIANTQRWHY